MKAEVAKMLDEGKSQEEILAAFADKYGTRVLSAPPVSGFNLSAWIMPFVALAIGVLAVAYVARRWKARWPDQAAVGAQTEPSKYDKRLEEELEKYTPED
jgi:cytochrome c-type biogenesis protein CcmH